MTGRKEGEHGRRKKDKKSEKIYNGFKGSGTLAAVFEQVPDDLAQELTANQIADVAELINKAYHKGRASTGAEAVEVNAVYVDSLEKIIEWNEEGAEYERVEEKTADGCTVVKNKKVKDGVLVPGICEYD